MPGKMDLACFVNWCLAVVLLHPNLVAGIKQRSLVDKRENAFEGVNLALNKPSFQTSIYTHDNGPNPPNLANDGTRRTDNIKYCAVTNRHTHPWWAVDLGGYYVIDHVIFTNRRNSYAYRSDNFVIGLTNTSPTVKPPKLKQYAVCGQYPGKVGSAATVSVKCKPGLSAFRYVIVQFPVNEYMNFCELEVYGRLGCPAGFTPNPHIGGCYKLVTDRLQWDIAAMRCNALNKDAYLIAIDSFAEQTAIAHMLAKDKGDCEMYWTGGQRLYPTDQNSDFVWKAKRKEDRVTSVEMSEMTYSNWKPGYPKYTGSRTVCAALSRPSYFAWEDRSCLDKYCFICEMDMEP